MKDYRLDLASDLNVKTGVHLLARCLMPPFTTDMGAIESATKRRQAKLRRQPPAIDLASQVC